MNIVLLLPFIARLEPTRKLAKKPVADSARRGVYQKPIKLATIRYNFNNINPIDQPSALFLADTGRLAKPQLRKYADYLRLDYIDTS